VSYSWFIQLFTENNNMWIDPVAFFSTVSKAYAENSVPIDFMAVSDRFVVAAFDKYTNRASLDPLVRDLTQEARVRGN
jgi:hypothetical protein